MLEGWRDGISLLSSRYYENGECVMVYEKPRYGYGYSGLLTLRLDPPHFLSGVPTKEDALKIYNIFKGTDDRDAAYAAVRVLFKLRGGNRGASMA